MTTDELLWYTARASGIVAWAVLTFSVLWGLLLSTRAAGTRLRANWLLDLHRFLGACGVVFVGVHLLAIALDGYVGFGIDEILVPFSSSWNPTAVAWGIAAFYLLIAVELTSLLRSRLSKRTWRAVHYLSFPLYVTATIHGLSAGSDAGSPLMTYAVLAALAPITVLTALRLLEGRRSDPTPRVATGRSAPRVPVGASHAR